MWQYTVTRGTVTLSDAAATRLDPAATEELFGAHRLAREASAGLQTSLFDARRREAIPLDARLEPRRGGDQYVARPPLMS